MSVIKKIAFNVSFAARKDKGATTTVQGDEGGYVSLPSGDIGENDADKAKDLGRKLKNQERTQQSSQHFTKDDVLRALFADKDFVEAYEKTADNNLVDILQYFEEMGLPKEKTEQVIAKIDDYVLQQKIIENPELKEQVVQLMDEPKDVARAKLEQLVAEGKITDKEETLLVKFIKDHETCESFKHDLKTSSILKKIEDNPNLIKVLLSLEGKSNEQVDRALSNFNSQNESVLDNGDVNTIKERILPSLKKIDKSKGKGNIVSVIESLESAVNAGKIFGSGVRRLLESEGFNPISGGMYVLGAVLEIAFEDLLLPLARDLAGVEGESKRFNTTRPDDYKNSNSNPSSQDKVDNAGAEQAEEINNAYEGGIGM